MPACCWRQTLRMRKHIAGKPLCAPRRDCFLLPTCTTIYGVFTHTQKYACFVAECAQIEHILSIMYQCSMHRQLSKKVLIAGPRYWVYHTGQAAEHYSALQCITVHYSALQCTTVHYRAEYGSVWQCSIFHYIAVHYSTLQCSILQCITLHLHSIAVHYSSIHYII